MLEELREENVGGISFESILLIQIITYILPIVFSQLKMILL